MKAVLLKAAFVISSVLVAAHAAEPQVAMPAYYAQSWADFTAQKARARAAKLPDWSGIWKRSVPFAVFMGFGDQEKPSPMLGPGYTQSSARLTPKYQAAYDNKVRNVQKGIEWDRLSYCLPVGMPRWLTEPWLREFIVMPQVTWLIHEQISEVRRIYTDGRNHTEVGKVGPLWDGESIGFWDADNLVIHTQYLKAGEYQRGQPDYSFKTSLVERWRPLDADTIRVEVTVYDPDSLLEPYKSSFTYKRMKDPDLWVNFSSCEQGNNAYRTPEGATSFRLPTEKGYRDPDTFGIPEVALDSLPQ